MRSAKGQGSNFPCASNWTGRPAISGSSTVLITWNGCWAATVVARNVVTRRTDSRGAGRIASKYNAGWPPRFADVYYLVPLPPSPLAHGIMGLAGIFSFGL